MDIVYRDDLDRKEMIETMLAAAAKYGYSLQITETKDEHIIEFWPVRCEKEEGPTYEPGNLA